jgi:hypothetical protein
MNFELRAPCLVRKELYHFTHTTTLFVLDIIKRVIPKLFAWDWL